MGGPYRVGRAAVPAIDAPAPRKDGGHGGPPH
jgi:hypothetical protein